MNKNLVFTVIAILLGTITIVLPITLLGPSDSIHEGQYNINSTDVGLDTQNRSYADEGSNEGSDTWTNPDLTDNPPEPLTNEANSTYGIDAKLTSIGLMIVPSFFIALGVFIYIKRRMF
jgi:hypothetical protein